MLDVGSTLYESFVRLAPWGFGHKRSTQNTTTGHYDHINDSKVYILTTTTAKMSV